jgi:hypothetical protein
VDKGKKKLFVDKKGKSVVYLNGENHEHKNGRVLSNPLVLIRERSLYLFPPATSLARNHSPTQVEQPNPW